ncbi:CO2 hydration protein [Umezakia ovalisporum]|nr:CO2 hydration protein [Umezakia ovalisporum]MBI1242623.1 CO2 hydration protein [Nostoc sp. RI_552]MDH6057936.1 CO2 hydration protein [Umezakia ovalisporum FSS-43]CEJ42171.1 CO2 hydration protein (Low-affinity CO2 hydration protein CphX) [Umezakia ovalisporum]
MVVMSKGFGVFSVPEYVECLLGGGGLVRDSEVNVMEVVGILKSYGVVLDAYSNNLIYIAEYQFLVFFPFFKYFNGKFSFKRLMRHWWHDRFNFEYAEYCVRAMMWHGGGGLDEFLDSADFQVRARRVIEARFKGNFVVMGVDQLFPDFLTEMLRVSAYCSGLGQFWRVMADIFLGLSDCYDGGEVKSIPDVVEYIRAGLVANAMKPISYAVRVQEEVYEIIPQSAGLTFLADVAVPYVEAVFFRGTPFHGTVSYNAQAYQIPVDQARFQYGALYADPLPIGGAGIPPTLLMQDMRHFLPVYLREFYCDGVRGEDDLRVKICMSFQKSMFCVTTAAILGLMPFPRDTQDSFEEGVNRVYLQKWMSRLEASRLQDVNEV